jgi:hypothetical protein
MAGQGKQERRAGWALVCLAANTPHVCRVRASVFAMWHTHTHAHTRTQQRCDAQHRGCVAAVAVAGDGRWCGAGSSHAGCGGQAREAGCD